jgi:hypothetical protein
MFTVIWRTRALDELADIVVQSDLNTQDLVERQVTALNKRLAADPLDVGESRGGSRRIAIADPICILFEVSAVNRIVRVLTCWTSN